MSILFICCCGCLTFDYNVYGMGSHLAAETAVRVAPGLCLRFVLILRGMMLKMMVMMMVMAKMMTVMRVKFTTVKRF